MTDEKCFAIKWISPDGNQRVEYGFNVTAKPYGVFDPELPATGDVDEFKNRAIVRYTTPTGARCTIDCGRIYVMNDLGTTVARYILPYDKEFPHGLEF